MRRTSPFLLACLFAAGAACGSTSSADGKPCPSAVEIVPVPVAAAARATSCAETFRWEGRAYRPWCAAVRDGKLVEVLGRSSDGYVARGLVGVETQAAIAVAAVDSNGEPIDDGCGAWRFAVTIDLPPETADRLARLVTAPGSIG